MVTGLYAGILALIYFGLSVYVISFRFKHKVSIGDGGHDLMQKAIRTHGNFAEFVPFALLLMLIIELNIVNPFAQTPSYLHVLGVLLVLGRLSHVLGMAGQAPIMRARQIGMVCTFAVLVISACILIFQYVTT
jgi:uncharacterized membrane protein YecN with MAPEG domain